MRTSSKHGVAKPGDAEFLYSNLGFGLLGQALANRAGLNYRICLQEEVTGPLGMSDTVVSLSRRTVGTIHPGLQRRHHPCIVGYGCDGRSGRDPLDRAAT